MQIGSAFTAVLSALNWFAENYIPLAQWRASAERVAVLHSDFVDFYSEARTLDGITQFHLWGSRLIGRSTGI